MVHDVFNFPGERDAECLLIWCLKKCTMLMNWVLLEKVHNVDEFDVGQCIIHPYQLGFTMDGLR